MDMTIETGNRLLPGIEHRPTELGRIRLGDKSPKGLPTKIETWRLTSANKAALEAAAAIYGGTVEAWTDAPDEGYFELLTESTALQVLIPRDLRTLSQWYEFWQGGTCERRCDGTTEQLSQMPCLCKAEGGDMTCRPRTRLNIMLPDVPGLGVWRLETDGWNAATSLPATIEMLLALSVQPWVKAVLRLEQRSAKKRQSDGKVITHRFAVPVLDTPNDLTLGRIVGQRMREEQPQLPEATPQTARERIAAQRAQLEATTSGEDTLGRVPSPGQDVGDDSLRDGSDAGVRTVTPTVTSGSTEADIPMPASPDDSGPSPLGPESSPTAVLDDSPPVVEDAGQMPPAPAGATERCPAFSQDHGGRCSRAPGHKGNHMASEGSWKEAVAK